MRNTQARMLISLVSCTICVKNFLAHKGTTFFLHTKIYHCFCILFSTLHNNPFGSYTFSLKISQNIWSIQKKAVPLCAFSAFGLQSSAAKGTDDVEIPHGNVDDLVSRLTDVIIKNIY